jgi:DNA-binding CsgD family transcriptional regulator
MNADAPTLRLAVDIGDAALEAQLRTAVAGIGGLVLVGADEPADLVVRAPDAAAPDLNLTARERDVLALLAEGASNRQVAQRLGISVHTAKFHVGSLLDKLDATGRTDAVAHAARHGIIHL